MSDETTTNDVSAPNAVEAEARSQGWRPKEEFSGPEHVWVDADTFVDRGKQILPIVQANERRLKRELAQLRADSVATQATVKEFADYHANVQARAYQQAMEDLKVKRHAAIVDGAAEEVVRLEKQMEVVHTQSQQATGPRVHQAAQVQDSGSEELADWTSQRAWWGTDRKRTQIAMAVAEEVQAQNPGLEGAPFLAELDKQLVVQFPAQFSDGRPSSRMEGPTTGSSRTMGRSRSFGALPQDAKEACRKFVSQGLLTEAQYVSEYDWS